MMKKINVKKPELLAPAGDLERLKWAIMYGADAVYIGGSLFGLRANATNFTLPEIKEAVTYAHDRDKKIYVTVNAALHNAEVKELLNYLKELDHIGIDAIIVSDPAVIAIAHEHTSLDIHLSTQQSTLNYEAVEYWAKEGVTRIVLGREVSANDIKEILAKVDIEIECFIHGAMCASYSGRCALSNFFTARDANRGGCSQICRWNFDLYDEDGKPLKGEQDFTFCTKDLTMLKHIPEMMDMGITSFKIEGRMRSIYYVATIVNVYRQVIDEYYNHVDEYEYNKEYEKILDNCANRDAITQFFDGNYDVSCNYYIGRHEVSNQDFLGVVLDYDESTHIATIEQRNYFKSGDIVEVFGPHHKPITITINDIIDDNNNPIDIVRHPQQVVRIPVSSEIEKNDLMRIKR